MALNNGNGFHMFKAWVESKGLEETLKDYYPDTLKKDPEIAAAYIAYKNAQRAILHRMEELNDNDNEADND